jgi:hypothetical protein
MKSSLFALVALAAAVCCAPASAAIVVMSDTITTTKSGASPIVYDGGLKAAPMSSPAATAELALNISAGDFDQSNETVTVWLDRGTANEVIKTLSAFSPTVTLTNAELLGLIGDGFIQFEFTQSSQVSANANNPSIFDASVTYAVPEPTTMALVAIGSVAGGVYARRRRRR